MSFKYERINKDDAMLLVVDHQEGLFLLTRDHSLADMRVKILAHSAIGKLFGLPTVLTTSEDTGFNGPILPEVLALHPDAPLIRRQGEVNAWDNPEFRKAVEATGKKQVIIAGIITDVCTTFCALSLVEAGYTVFANSDASGTFDVKTASEANDRMRAAGVQVLSMYAVFGELMRDWRELPGGEEVMTLLEKCLPGHGLLARTRAAAAAAVNGMKSRL